MYIEQYLSLKVSNMFNSHTGRLLKKIHFLGLKLYRERESRLILFDRDVVN